MFTGIVEQMGRIREIATNPFGARLRIDPQGWTHEPAPGDSVAVNGCCLTVAGTADDGVLDFDVIQQTLRVTTLGGLAEGHLVNLEHSATPTTLLGGHIVQGHVDGVGIVEDVLRGEEEHRISIRPEALELLDFIVDKGSISVEGVSLTLAAINATGFEVALIPTTLEKTTLNSLEAGDRVNLETDCLARMVVHYLQRQGLGGAVAPSG